MKIPNTSIQSKSATTGEAGFSLLELIISITLFGIVTASVFGLLQVARQSRTAVTENTNIFKNVRVAMNLVGRDAYNAGYGYPLRNTVVLPDNRVSTLLGIPNDADSSRDTVPPIIAGNDVTTSTFNTVANTKTDQVTFLFKDTSFNLVGGVSQPLNVNAATTLGSGSTGIDEIVPISGSNSVCKINDLYLISGNTGSTLGLTTALSGTNKIQFANGDAMLINLSGSTGPLRGITVPASIQKVRMVTYFVTPDGTFTRREYGNVEPNPVGSTPIGSVDEPLVYGVENLQIIYVMDDGTTTSDPSAGVDGIPGNGDDTPANLAAVRQIRFTISVRSTELNVDKKPFKTTLTSTFSTRNLGYDAN